MLLAERGEREPAPATPAAALERATGRRCGVLFQPIVVREPDGEGQCRWRYAGAEALLRAESGKGLSVRPDQLLPLIERAGMLPTLFDFVLGETLAALGRWQRAGAGRFGAAVNVHASALLDERLPDALGALLSVAGVEPGRLTLEISESAPISDLRRAARTLRRVRALGVRVALDDFGAGFSTATRLAWLECDELKIDRALVHGLEYCDEQRCVVENLVALAHAHGMAALAEGVETEAALEILSELGCDRAQGYLIARPMAVEELSARARDWHGADGITVAARHRQLPLPGFGQTVAWWTGGELDAIA
ncbi:MAG TPA: EAL domain-containing protein [Steroidobacteraceae bacterium]|nr:EAL domain-containing protein [Steroidobacteraceae bacterium]